ncbi:MAG: tetratricopeptide repeat protein [Myxococcales bacterium]|nr:tetratricopeptide repeat protein [Myxococcales bacterium]MCB9644525.1 tetratricopeptide repeat protein [Myxococcales bacterium]
MKTFALHTTDLPSFAQGWPAQLAALVEAQLESNIPSHELRTIVFSRTHDGLRAGLWLGVEWENYPYAGREDEAVGFISLAPWLDTLDAIALGTHTVPPRQGFTPRQEIQFEDPERQASFHAWWGTLFDALVASAIKLATQHLSKHFKQTVGVFVSMTGEEASLVAFCHPQGGPLWPIQEHRREHGYGSCYPFASLSDEQLVIFYPKGEGEGENSASSIRSFSLSDVRFAQVDDGEVHVRWRDEDFDVRFSGGHTKRGGPNQDQVLEAFVAWCRKTGNVLASKEELLPPLPTSTQELQTILEKTAGGEQEQVNTLGQLAQKYGARQLSPLLQGLSFPESSLQMFHRSIVSEASKQQDWQLSWEHFKQIQDQTRILWMKARVLAALGRWEEILEFADKKCLSEHALALHQLGRSEEALALLEGKSEANHLLVKAMILLEHDPDKAKYLAAQALILVPGEHLLLHLEAEAAFAGIIQAHKETKAKILASVQDALALPFAPSDFEGGITLTLSPLTKVLAVPPASEEERESTSYWLATPRDKGFLIADRDGHLFAFSRDGESKKIASFESRPSALLETPHGIVVSCGGVLSLHDEDGQLLTSTLLPWRGDGPVAYQDGLLAVTTGEVLHLYEVGPQRLEWLCALGTPEKRYVRSVGFLNKTQLLYSTEGVLLVADLSNPSAPKLLWQTKFSVEILSTQNNTALLNNDGTALFTRWTGKGFVCEKRLKLGYSPIKAVDEEQGKDCIAWRGHVVRINGQEVESMAMLGADGNALEPIAMVLCDGMAQAVTSETCSTATELPLELEAMKTSLTGVEAEIARWVEAQLEGWVEEGITARDGTQQALGGIILSWYESEALLRPCTPSSIVCMEDCDCWTLKLERAPKQEEPDQETNLSQEAKTQQEQLRYLQEQAKEGLQAKAAKALLQKVALAWTHRLKTRDFSLLYQRKDNLRVVDVVVGGGEILPKRAKIEEVKQKPLEEMMSDNSWYKHVDVWAARARYNDGFRAEIFQLLKERSYRAAKRVALELISTHLQEVSQVFLAVAEEDAEFAVDGLCECAEAGNKACHERLLSLLDAPSDRVALAARLSLKRVDEESTVERLKRYLPQSAAAEDLTLPILSALSEARLTQLLPLLRDSYNAWKDANSWLAAKLLPLLVRGGWVPDEETLSQGNQKRSVEDDFLADILGEDNEEAEAQAVRIWAALCITTNLGKEGQLWPEKIPAEKNRTGWRRFFASAWPLWTRQGVLSRILEALPRYAQEAATSEDSNPHPDKQLAFHALYEALLRGAPEATALGEALELVPWEEKARKDIFRLARLSRLKCGWALLKAERWSEARQIADTMMAEAPTDGQVRFFEARLTWLEAGDPSVAIPRIMEALKVAEDGVGRARLFNLHGAALDALGRVDEALPLFEKAYTTNEATISLSTGLPQDTTMSHAILSNIAEAHWKLGNKEKAFQYAQDAGRRGSATEIVKMLLDLQASETQA